jgi:hypothetical protein
MTPIIATVDNEAVCRADRAALRSGQCVRSSPSLAMMAGVTLTLAACKFPELPPIDVDGTATDGATTAVDAPALDAAEDGSMDAPTDAPLLPAFDIAYPSEWRFSVSGPAEAFILIVNTGPSPLSLATFQVSSVSDNHPTAVARVTSPSSSGTTLQPNDAGGMLSLLSEQLLVGSGLVTEPWVDRTSQLLALELLSAPAGTYDVAVNLTISLDGRDAPLPMTIHVVPGPTVYLDPLVARRVMIYR